MKEKTALQTAAAAFIIRHQLEVWGKVYEPDGVTSADVEEGIGKLIANVETITRGHALQDKWTVIRKAHGEYICNVCKKAIRGPATVQCWFEEDGELPQLIHDGCRNESLLMSYYSWEHRTTLRLVLPEEYPWGFEIIPHDNKAHVAYYSGDLGDDLTAVPQWIRDRFASMMAYYAPEFDPPSEVVQEQVELPEGWKVTYDSCVGYTMHDETGMPLSQHPEDNSAWRRYTIGTWIAHKRKEACQATGHATVVPGHWPATDGNQ